MWQDKVQISESGERNAVFWINRKIAIEGKFLENKMFGVNTGRGGRVSIPALVMINNLRASAGGFLNVDITALAK